MEQVFAKGQFVRDTVTGQVGVIVSVTSYPCDPMWWGYEVQLEGTDLVDGIITPETVRMIGYRMENADVKRAAGKVRK